MNLFRRDEPETVGQEKPRVTGSEEWVKDYPPAKQSLAAIRVLTDKMRGTMRIRRGDYTWTIEATFHSSIDYELSVSGASLDEAAFVALDAVEQMVPE